MPCMFFADMKAREKEMRKRKERLQTKMISRMIDRENIKKIEGKDFTSAL